MHKPTVKDGIEFFTPSDSEQQVGVIRRRSGWGCEPHEHNKQNRTIFNTSETLLICKGKLEFFLYSRHKPNSEPIVVFRGVAVEGDILILLSGGHGFNAVEDVEIIEVKTGPYYPTSDKTFLFQDQFAEGLANG